jgi:hypothetical protein
VTGPPSPGLKRGGLLGYPGARFQSSRVSPVSRPNTAIKLQGYSRCRALSASIACSTAPRHMTRLWTSSLPFAWFPTWLPEDGLSTPTEGWRASQNGLTHPRPEGGMTRRISPPAPIANSSFRPSELLAASSLKARHDPSLCSPSRARQTGYPLPPKGRFPPVKAG